MANHHNIEQTIRVLKALREYMYNFYPDRRTNNPFPLEFWKLDDDLYYDFLNYLPCVFSMELGGLDTKNLRDLPEALHILWPIFSLEDGYDCDGWTALTNAGVAELPLAISAYRKIGFTKEAQALRAALASCEASPDDTDAAESAYKSVQTEYEDDGDRRMAVISFMRSNEHLWNHYSDT
ncbi:MAG: hypothetical protein LBE15_05960 [Burkholderiales bacterium]|nr:hypothetical protein [Burkholderiales bacterium]